MATPAVPEECPALMPTCLPQRERGAAMVAVVGESFTRRARKRACRASGSRREHVEHDDAVRHGER